VNDVKKILYFIIIFFLSAELNAQQFHSCPLDHHFDLVYENPLYDQWLSKYDVKFYHISLEVSNENTYIEGFTTIGTQALEAMDTIVFQLIDELIISAVEVNGGGTPGFDHRDDAIYIPVDASPGESLDVTVRYSGDAGQARGFFAGITSAYDNTNEQWVTYTLSEPLNARDWFPVKQVLTDQADSVWVDLTVDQGLMAGSNGLLEEIEDLGNGKQKFKWRTHYTTAYYLISLAVADYRDYSFNAELANGTDSVLVQNYIYDDDAYFQEWKSRIDDTGDMISLYSGLVADYPFANEKYGHAVAPMGGGMEHQTMTTLSNFSFTLVAHELAHQWFGDNITCATWQDIWVNEGFASYFEYIALQNLYDQETADNWMEYAMALAKEETGSVYVPEELADDVYRVFDYGLTYKKGATLLHMIRYELDDDSLFFSVLREYTERYAGGLATAVDFMEVLEELSGRDFSCFFDQWYYGKGFPDYNIVGSVEHDTLLIRSLQESTSEETPLFKMHFDLRVVTAEGVTDYRLYQEENEEVFRIPVSSNVFDIQFDPDKHLLARSYTDLQLPDGKDFVYGPNPAENYLILKFRNHTGLELLSVYTLEGKLVKEVRVTSNPYQLDLSHMDDGTYVLTFDNSMVKEPVKIVKVGPK